VLFDWALACKGPLIQEIVFFIPSVEAEGGPSGEVLLKEYKEVMSNGGIEFPLFAEQSAAAFIAGLLAIKAGKPSEPGLPRLRRLRQLQLVPALKQAARLLHLPEPPMIHFTS
jgi:hypothetical protein